MKTKKVNFMILGAMKCGTSTLATILRNHPEIGFCKKKEPNFFSQNKNWKKNLDKYHSLFNFNEGNIFGEASTSYTKYPRNNLEIWKDIYEYNKNMKFVYIVRNPVDRAISHYMHSYERGYIHSTFEEEINKTEIINTGRYYTQIRPFIEKFGLDKILIIDFDDLINDRLNILMKISGFLNINFHKFNDFKDVHSNKSVGGFKKSIKEEKWAKYFESLKILPLLRIIPEKTRKLITYIIFNNSKRAFNKKIEPSNKYRNLILNLTMLDIIKMEEIMKKDLSKWKKLAED